MTWIESFLLGVVEGVTEFLPISSTAHLQFTEKLLGLDLQDDFLKCFSIVIQLGAILAVVMLYWRALLVRRRVLLLVIAGFVPTGFFGLLLHHYVKDWHERPEIALCSLGIGGLLLVLFESLHGEKPNGIDEVEKMTLWQAAVIGMCQVIAMIPGVSRSAATVVGGMLLGIKRKTAVEYTFLLAVPTMTAASGYELFKEREHINTENLTLLGIGFAVSFVVGWLSIEFLLRFVKTHTFIAFGVYRMIAAVVLAYLFFWA